MSEKDEKITSSDPEIRADTRSKPEFVDEKNWRAGWDMIIEGHRRMMGLLPDDFERAQTGWQFSLYASSLDLCWRKLPLMGVKIKKIETRVGDKNEGNADVQ